MSSFGSAAVIEQYNDEILYATVLFHTMPPPVVLPPGKIDPLVGNVCSAVCGRWEVGILLIQINPRSQCVEPVVFFTRPVSQSKRQYHQFG